MNNEKAPTENRQHSAYIFQTNVPLQCSDCTQLVKSVSQKSLEFSLIEIRIPQLLLPYCDLSISEGKQHYQN